MPNYNDRTDSDTELERKERAAVQDGIRRAREGLAEGRMDGEELAPVEPVKKKSKLKKRVVEK